jgi:hypothetical protein
MRSMENLVDYFITLAGEAVIWASKESARKIWHLRVLRMHAMFHKTKFHYQRRASKLSFRPVVTTGLDRRASTYGKFDFLLITLFEPLCNFTMTYLSLNYFFSAMTVEVPGYRYLHHLGLCNSPSCGPPVHMNNHSCRNIFQNLSPES